MLFFHDQSPPEGHELFGGFDEALKIEELGLAVGAMVMVNRDFFELEPQILKLFHHLEADGAGGGSEIDFVEDGPANEPVVAIHITQPESKKEAHDRVIEPSDQDSMQGVGAGDLESVDHVAVLCNGLD